MISRLVKLLCPLAVLWNAAYAQTDGKASNLIALEIGPHIGYFRDLNYSPLNYRETGVQYSLAYSRKNIKENLLFTADIDITSGKLKTDASEYFTTNFFQANVEVSLLFRWPMARKDKLLIFIGPQYNSYFQYMQWGDERDSWTYLMAHGLNMKGLAVFNFSSRSSVQTSLSVPVLSNLVRPPYNGFDQYIVEHAEHPVLLSFRGETASFDKYLAFDWKVTYRYDVSKHLGFVLGYRGRYQDVQGINNLVQFQNQFTAGCQVKW